MEIDIDAIKVGERFRKELGDIESLAASMKEGQLAPVGLNSDNVLLYGFRRLQAAKLLGWTTIEVFYPKDRDEAITRMERALRETIIDGVSHVTPLHRLILADEKFRAGEIHTGFVGAFLDRSYQLVAGAQKESVG